MEGGEVDGYRFRSFEVMGVLVHAHIKIPSFRRRDTSRAILRSTRKRLIMQQTPSMLHNHHTHLSPPAQSLLNILSTNSPNGPNHSPLFPPFSSANPNSSTKST